MVSTFISPVIGRASELGVSLYEDSEPVELFAHSSEAEIEIVIRAVYRQVLGNVHVMESERLTVPESQLKNREITIREFVRQVAKSELYSSLFFLSCPTLRTIELNFKHLLGRAPESHEEIVKHTQILDESGWDAEIDSYIDSEEYQENFGDNIVPYYLGYKTQTGKNVAGFTHIFQILRGSCSSDRSIFASTRSQLQKSLIANKPSPIIPLSQLPASWKPTPPPDNVNQLLSKALGLKNYQSVAPAPIVPTKPKEEEISSRASIWQGQYNALANANPLELTVGSSQAELEIVIKAVYKQVLGNAHIMESERLTVPESQLKRGEISVREFVRQVAKSEFYKSRFIDNCPRYRSHELNFKHLLGRAPDDYQETLHHSNILDREGYEADIDSYIDSDEYQNAFGESIVPYYRGYKTQTGKRLLGYTNMFAMLPSVSTSDKAGASGNQSRLARPLIYNNPGGNVPVSNIEQLLAEVLKPKFDFVIPAQSFSPSQTNQALQQECEEQEKTIASLEQKLRELQSFATIGAAGLSKWQSYLTNVNGSSETTSSFSTQNQGRISFAQPGSYEALQQRSQDQQDKIASLKQQIAQSQSLANLGEARLNKWRSRAFF